MKLFGTITQKTLTAILCATLCSTMAKGQLTLNKLEEKFVRYNENVLQEKLYMHVDRSFYLAGEILWCKLYVVDALLHQPLDVSKVAYVEVLDANNTPALQAKIGLDKGKGYGSLSLPVTLRSGHYKIRGYTSWMKNNGPDYFFEQAITIVNTQKSREPQTGAAKASEPEIRFFPEGGNMVAGLSSKVACKITGPNGKGIDYSATVVDENNKTVAQYKSLRFGMGHFVFTPEKGHTYTAQIEAGGNRYHKALPFVFERGYVLQLSGGNGSPLVLNVQSNTGDAGQLFLLAQTRQSLKSVQQAALQGGRASFQVDASNLGEGITQFTLLNAEGKPLCERLYFTWPTHDLSIDVAGALASYDTRAKVEWNIKTGGVIDTAAADLSVAVYKLDELQDIPETNIRSYLWLASDLKGYIESPDYYFSKDNKDAAAAMDNLMLTQGWRRFAWDDVIRESTPEVKFPAEHNGHIVSGKVTSSVTGKPLENIETFVSVPGMNGNTKVGVSDASGRFSVDFKTFRGTSEMIVQTDPQADPTARVEIASPFSDQYTTTATAPFVLSGKYEKMLSDRSMSVRVQQVYTGQELRQFENPYDTTTEFQKPEGVYMIDDYTRFSTMEEIMREYVNSMELRDARSAFTIRLIENTSMPMNGMAHTDFFPTQPLVLVDGVPLFNTDKLMKLEPLKMRKVEVYNKRFVMGRSSFAGILSWSTYKGNLTDIELDPRALVIDYEALQLKREFYSPVYDAANPQENMPDYRTLLYWSYDIPRETDGAQHVRFFTSDKKGKYIAVVEGLTSGGQCGVGTWRFEVK